MFFRRMRYSDNYELVNLTEEQALKIADSLDERDPVARRIIEAIRNHW